MVGVGVRGPLLAAVIAAGLGGSAGVASVVDHTPKGKCTRDVTVDGPIRREQVYVCADASPHDGRRASVDVGTLASVHPRGEAHEARWLALSGDGGADAVALAAAKDGNAEGALATSHDGDADGIVAIANQGDADGFVAVANNGNARGAVAVAIDGDARGDRAAVAVYGHADGFVSVAVYPGGLCVRVEVEPPAGTRCRGGP